MGDIHVTWDKGQLTFDNQEDSPSLTVKCELSLVPCHVYITLIIQMWLLTATLEAYLAGHPEPILPAAIISGLIFMACAGLFFLIHRIDADVKTREGRDESSLH